MIQNNDYKISGLLVITVGTGFGKLFTVCYPCQSNQVGAIKKEIANKNKKRFKVFATFNSLLLINPLFTPRYSIVDFSVTDEEYLTMQKERQKESDGFLVGMGNIYRRNITDIDLHIKPIKSNPLIESSPIIDRFVYNVVSCLTTSNNGLDSLIPMCDEEGNSFFLNRDNLAMLDIKSFSPDLLLKEISKSSAPILDYDVYEMMMDFWGDDNSEEEDEKNMTVPF
jgi:hypothetical protein